MTDQAANAERLRQLYAQGGVAKAFFDYASGRERDQSETKVDRALYLLNAAGHAFERPQIVQFFRELESCAVGSFVVGRRGWPSRFIWNSGFKVVARVVTGAEDTGVGLLLTNDPNDGWEAPEPVRNLDSFEPVDEEEDAPEEIGEGGGTGLEAEEEDPGAGTITQPFDPAKIRVDTRPMVVSLLLDRIRNDEINLTPGFQRKGGIWNHKAKSQLIESLLIRIPLPAFYMDGGDESCWLVVDGLQRLSTLKSFAIEKTLRLSGMEFLKQYEGKTFDDLPRALQRRILETQVTVFLIQEHTPPEVKFNIFKRINTGGLPLSSQEIRHALNQGPAAHLLQTLSESEEFKVATNDGIRDDRMGDRECILRLLAFMSTPYSEYRSNDLDAFLNDRMVRLNQLPPSELAQLSARFERTMTDCRRIFGDRAFRKQERGSRRRFPINRALFEVWAASVEALSKEQVDKLVPQASELERRFVQLLEDDEFKAAISFGTGDPRRVHVRFGRVKDLLSEMLQ